MGGSLLAYRPFSLANVLRAGSFLSEVRYRVWGINSCGLRLLRFQGSKAFRLGLVRPLGENSLEHIHLKLSTTPNVFGESCRTFNLMGGGGATYAKKLS